MTSTFLLNGYPVIHRSPHREQLGAVDGLEAVIVWRADAPEAPFVVAAWAPSMGQGWHQGDYCPDLGEAIEAHNARSAAPIVTLAGASTEAVADELNGLDNQQLAEAAAHAIDMLAANGAIAELARVLDPDAAEQLGLELIAQEAGQ